MALTGLRTIEQFPLEHKLDFSASLHHKKRGDKEACNLRDRAANLLPIMNKHVTLSRHGRRQFIKYGAMAVGGAVVTGPYLLRGQNLNSKLNIAQIGCAGKGGGDAQCIYHAEQNIVALCDVRSDAVNALKRNLPNANTYKDYRELLDKEKGIDAVD